MKGSLRSRMICILCLLVFFVIITFWLLTNIFLEKYYVLDIQNNMRHATREVTNIVNAVDNDYTQINKLYSVMEKYRDENNFSFIIMKPDPTPPNYFVFVNTMLELQSTEEITAQITGDINKSIPDKKNLKNMDDVDLLMGKDIDERTKGLYYVSIATIKESQNIVYIRTSVASVITNTSTSNLVMLYVGGMILIISAILAYYLAISITKPITQMSLIAQHMATLDFGEKYHGKSRNEIGVLGNSLNLLSEELERNISELKISNEKLEKEVARRIEIDDMRKEFLSNVSHELKTPIALVMGYAEGLKDNVIEDAESKDFYCEVIIDETEKMNKMVKKLLTLNQLEFGSNTIQYNIFDIIAVLSSHIKRNEIQAAKRQIKLKFSAGSPVYVSADEYMIEEVISNFLSNAFHHVSVENEIRVDYALTPETIRVSVYNSGSHIPEDELDKVWIKFYKIDKARTREYGGSGIGLSIVQAVINAHHAKNGVYNTESGIVFWFELDRCQTEPENEPLHILKLE